MINLNVSKYVSDAQRLNCSLAIDIDLASFQLKVQVKHAVKNIKYMASIPMIKLDTSVIDIVELEVLEACIKIQKEVGE